MSRTDIPVHRDVYGHICTPTSDGNTYRFLLNSKGDVLAVLTHKVFLPFFENDNACGAKVANHIQRPISEKGSGVFAAQNIKQGEHIFHVDLTGFQKHTLTELERVVEGNPELDGDHANYVGRGKYVIEHAPASYMNHSCDPNCYFKMKSIAVYDVYALRDIAEGEELTHDSAPVHQKEVSRPFSAFEEQSLFIMTGNLRPDRKTSKRTPL